MLAVLGAVQQWWWLVTLAAMLLLSVTMLFALDADRRVRALRTFVRSEVSRVSSRRPARGREADERPAVTAEDVVGTLRTLQEQHTGRLDRLQDTLEATLRRGDGHG